MRAVTFFGLMIIASCIDKDRLSEHSLFVAITTTVLLIFDFIEFLKKMHD